MIKVKLFQFFYVSVYNKPILTLSDHIRIVILIEIKCLTDCQLNTETLLPRFGIVKKLIQNSDSNCI